MNKELIEQLKLVNPFELLEFALANVVMQSVQRSCDTSYVVLEGNTFKVFACDIDPAPDATNCYSEQAVITVSIDKEDWQDSILLQQYLEQR